MEILNRLREATNDTAVTGTSFQAELGQLLLRRTRIAFAWGFLIGLAVHFFYGNVVDFHPTVESALTAHLRLVYDLYAIALFVATVLVWARQWTARQILVIDYVVVSLIILLTLFIGVVYDVVEIPAFGVSLALFIHAALIPVPVNAQAGLALTAAIGYPLLMVGAYFRIPEIHEYWQQSGGPTAFGAMMAEGTFYLVILGIVSVMITKSLYNMRKSLHKAKQLGAYVLESELAEGGMGQVFVAQHALMCRPTAVKVIKPETSGEHAAVARFEREVKLAAGLSHPNTITIYDFGRTEDNTFYYAMEYLKGMDLRRVVERFGPMPPERVVHVLTQICGALAEAHECGVIHRDIKPANIVLTRRGRIHDFVKVLDFGLAKSTQMEDDSGITKTGMIFGTPAYCAPETVDGADQVDARADLYNVGGVAYWMLTARPPFERKSALETILAHLRDQPTNPAELTEVDIPDALVQVVMKCLAKDPGARYQDADELNAALFDIEFSKPWTDARARDWWELHAPDEELESREAVKMGGEGEAETDTPERRLFARSGAGKKN